VINLSIPIIQDSVYGIIADVLVGPFGSTTTLNEEMKLRVDTDSLAQSRGLFGDNNVFHNKSEGNVAYIPYANALKNTPTSTYPLHRTMEVGFASGSSWRTNIVLLYGDLRTSSYGYAIHPSGYTHKAYLGVEGGFRLYTITCSNLNPKNVAVYYNEIRNIRRNGSNITFEGRTVQMSLPNYNPPYGTTNVRESWITPKSFGAMMEVINRAAPTALGNFSLQSTTAYKLYTQSVVSPAKMKLDIFSCIGGEDIGKDPNELIDYGVLAMRATEKVNANQVNMIAFLRDLKDVTSLVPKLKNFWQLKTMADNYLSINYGVLPTIDDIKKIVRAVQGIKPYLDRNGFQVVTAVHNATASKANVTFKLEQRIKVAIDKEDEGLLALINQVDSMGFLLTMENLWDLIPYSFVIDWFLDIGGLLARFDTQLRIMRLGVRYSTLSWKRTTTIVLSPTPSLPYLGTIDLVQYHRWVVGHCPEPPLSLQTQEDFNHWIEAAALIIQRSKN